MEDLPVNCGNYEKSHNLAKHINDITSHGGHVAWGDRLYIDMDNLSRERPEVQRTVLDIAASFGD